MKSHAGHVVGFYDRDEELVTSAAAFLADAFTDSGTALVVATAEHRNAIRVALAADHPIDSLEEAGRYVTLDAATTLARILHDGIPDRDAFAATLSPIIDALEAPVRIFGEMVALLWDDDLIHEAIELETLWNEFGERHAFGLFCAYPVSALDGDETLASVKRMCDEHSDFVVDRYRPPSIGDQHETARVFVPAPTALTNVRRFVRETLEAWGLPAILDDVQLIASELATNAAIHAESPFRVSVLRTNSGIRITVRDACIDEPTSRSATSHELGGRGLELVAALSDAWGTHADAEGKTVWADVTMPSLAYRT